MLLRRWLRFACRAGFGEAPDRRFPGAFDSGMSDPDRHGESFPLQAVKRLARGIFVTAGIFGRLPHRHEEGAVLCPVDLRPAFTSG